MRDASRAQAAYAGALSVASECGMRPLMAHCHVALGELLSEQGERQQGRQHLATGFAFYRDMAMPLWLKAEVIEANLSR
jgi:hypothetical protein